MHYVFKSTQTTKKGNIKLAGDGLSRKLGRTQLTFSTVADVQGRETEILIYSAVKATRFVRRRYDRISIGIVADLRPLFVTLSRAKYHLYIV